MQQKTLSFVLGAWVIVMAVLLLHYYSAYTTLSNIQVSGKNAANIFQVASTTGENYLTVTAGGAVGVDTAVPIEALDVRGAIRTYLATSTACTTTNEGTIFFSGYTKHFYGCNGTDWHLLDK